MDERIEKLEKEIELIKERNRKVELDKSWETSKMRAVFILILTYICATLALYFIGVQNYFLSAIIPTLGFSLSIQSLPFLQKWWMKNNK